MTGVDDEDGADGVGETRRGDRTDGIDRPDGTDRLDGTDRPDGNDSTDLAARDEGDDPNEDDPYPDVPDWEDEYLDRVSDRLMFNYDLEKEYTVQGEVFDLYGEMNIRSQKHFFHPALSYAHHQSTEHLFARRVDAASVADLRALTDLGDVLAEEWIDADEEHFSTDFTFAVVVPRVRPEVREFVEGFDGRSLLKFGYYGHYEVNLVVASPEEETVVASENADVGTAFATWEEIESDDDPGLLDLIARRLQI